jgi:hypothetical protein
VRGGDSGAMVHYLEGISFLLPILAQFSKLHDHSQSYPLTAWK